MQLMQFARQRTIAKRPLKLCKREQTAEHEMIVHSIHRNRRREKKIEEKNRFGLCYKMHRYAVIQITHYPMDERARPFKWNTSMNYGTFQNTGYSDSNFAHKMIAWENVTCFSLCSSRKYHAQLLIRSRKLLCNFLSIAYGSLRNFFLSIILAQKYTDRTVLLSSSKASLLNNAFRIE